MFNAMIVAALLALTTWYCALQGDSGALATRSAQRGQASAMAAYRQTVVAYFTAHPERYQAAPAPQPAMPAGQGGFANYRLADGTILVYALAPQPGLTGELLALSQRSHMVGRFSDGVFRSALSGAPSAIATPPLAIPNGGPVWLAAAN
ncbi:hypothetical protein HF313_16535 [Massilia atriviolacea]|uniref:Pilus assembly protein PilM n=1 Tax=Massilia atriviolacea TaxID=2495579 RepID=A0A430HUN9_9BURK|nr:hypothetical protein [Massilia atriviolacea]RSZ61084.1 hypothetical protein EJB06_02860 [Massilia atriviolacea]